MKCLSEKKHISLEKYNSKITPTSWIAWIMSYMEKNEMDTVFCVYIPDLNTEVYLLDDWGEAKDGKVYKWGPNPYKYRGWVRKIKLSPYIQL